MTGGIIEALYPDDIHDVIDSWGQISQTGEGLDSWPTDFTRDIRPVRCHSHNDYWRRVPLYSAISAGCISVEADIWLYNGELYVGHSAGSLTRNRTLKSLYINPVMDILSKQNPITSHHTTQDSPRNGVFDTNLMQPLTLLVEFKTSGPTLWPYLFSALEPLRSRGYLSHWNGTHVVSGPVVVVATGDAPFDRIASDQTNPYHDIFYDAPLETMWEDEEWVERSSGPKSSKINDGKKNLDGKAFMEDDKPLGIYPWGEDKHLYKPGELRSYHKDYSKAIKDTRYLSPRDFRRPAADARLSPRNTYNESNSYYASASFSDTVGRMWRYSLSAHQKALLRGQIRGAHRRGLKVRYWDLPDWPIGLRNSVWKILMEEGVDVLSVDDLRAASRSDWGKRSPRRGRHFR